MKRRGGSVSRAVALLFAIYCTAMGIPIAMHIKDAPQWGFPVLWLLSVASGALFFHLSERE